MGMPLFSSPWTGTQLWLFLGLQPAGSGAVTYTISSPDSRVFGLRLHLGSPGSSSRVTAGLGTSGSP